jgi:hypothetical protein
VAGSCTLNRNFQCTSRGRQPSLPELDRTEMR